MRRYSWFEVVLMVASGVFMFCVGTAGALLYAERLGRTLASSGRFIP